MFRSGWWSATWSIFRLVKGRSCSPACTASRTEWFPETPAAIARPRAQQGPSRISQSERDWAETLDRLQHGESPAAVQAWLEQKRQDKSDPAYYGALTVRKAVAELERRRAASIEAEIS